MNFFNKFFLDIDKVETISHSVVLVEKNFFSLKGKLNKAMRLQIQSPFSNLANSLALKSVFKKPVIEPFSNSLQSYREFESDNFVITYDKLSLRFGIEDKIPEQRNNLVRKIATDLINLAEVEEDIGAIGVNYEMFLPENNLDLKKLFLKKDIAETFDNLFITPVFEIDKFITLNLKIVSGIVDYKEGIFFDVNFHIEIDEYGSQKISNILENDFCKIAKNKILHLMAKTS